ncbi:MAG: hypothetical protein FJX67_16225 [Alphaproteobacteria bacterium]|nr:hypothetical protein [Alphaproteobacteria bacterium]
MPLQRGLAHIGAGHATPRGRREVVLTENLVLAIIVALMVWAMMRHWRMVQARRAMRTRPASTEPRPTMPRFGTPGTITSEQIQLLKRNLFDADRGWSFEEAALILDATAYAKALLAAETGRRDHDIDVLNPIFTFIMTDPDLRAYIIEWGRNRARRLISGQDAQLRRNEHYARVAAHAQSVLNRT